ncbi:hypothetical protein JRQ81_001199 [Phrynocephalus forsythii]|uniref:G-protein coupled receptors family 1 profile domain-containing protein n=1 Tax=Phrynocephalus forsythii TaxID=171643 RepID=A0A9Q0YA15_9SAUR|nr:hypothetical protein JRQ81_001199 [Phrynocephalus forsythii]
MCNSTDMPYEESRHLLVVVYSVVFAVGLPANCITAIVTFIQIGRKNITAIYLFGLSLCELMYLSTLPLWIVYVQNGHSWTLGLTSCRVTGYIFFCNIYISILLLCCISVDRYVAVVYALESRGKRCQMMAAVVTVFLFTVVAAIYSPVFFLSHIQSMNNTTCFEEPLNRPVAYYNVVRFFVGFTLPFLLLICMNYKIFQSIKTSGSLSSSQKAKVKHLAWAVIAIFVICFAPYHSVLLAKAIAFLLYPKEACAFERDIYTTSVVFLCFSTANAVADPFIYVLVSENAQREIRRPFRVCKIQFPAFPKTESSHIHDSPSQKLPLEAQSLGNEEDS